MNFTRWDYEFDGSYSDAGMLEPKAGVYVIWCDTGNSWDVLDVGESEDVVDRINNHDRRDCWFINCNGTIRYSATYISDPEERRDLENRIRSHEKVICGEK